MLRQWVRLQMWELFTLLGIAAGAAVLIFIKAWIAAGILGATLAAAIVVIRAKRKAPVDVIDMTRITGR